MGNPEIYYAQWVLFLCFASWGLNTFLLKMMIYNHGAYENESQKEQPNAYAVCVYMLNMIIPALLLCTWLLFVGFAPSVRQYYIAFAVGTCIALFTISIEHDDKMEKYWKRQSKRMEKRMKKHPKTVKATGKLYYISLITFYSFWVLYGAIWIITFFRRLIFRL